VNTSTTVNMSRLDPSAPDFSLHVSKKPQQQNYSTVRLSGCLKNCSPTHARAAPNTNGSSHQTGRVFPQGRLHVLPRLLENWCCEVASSTTAHWTLPSRQKTEWLLICHKSWGKRNLKPNGNTETGMHCQRWLVARAAV
jgi:hypothetical protein